MPAPDDNQQTQRGKTMMDLSTVSLLPRLESQGPENIVDQVCKLRIDENHEIFVSEHNTARIKVAAMAAHYKAYARDEDIQESGEPWHVSACRALLHFGNAKYPGQKHLKGKDTQPCPECRKTCIRR